MGSNKIGGAGDERGTDVEQIRTHRPEVSETEIARVFEDLGLETQEQRDAILWQGAVSKPVDSSKVRYILRLSNSTKAAPTA